MKQKIFQADVTIHATAYIKATSEAAARRALRGLALRSPDIPGGDGSVEVSKAQLDSPQLPRISLSPAMTIDEDVGRSGTAIKLVLP